MPVHPNGTILSMQTGVAYCNVPSNFSGTHGLHVYLFSISSSSSVQDSFSHTEGEYNDDDINLHINVCTSCKECRPRPGASITVRRWARVCILCISPVPIYSHENGILRIVKSGPTLYAGRQTMVFTECNPLFYQFINKTDSDQAPHDATPGLCLTKQCRP